MTYYEGQSVGSSWAALVARIGLKLKREDASENFR